VNAPVSVANASTAGAGHTTPPHDQPTQRTFTDAALAVTVADASDHSLVPGS
jgi:hypothetical protein